MGCTTKAVVAPTRPSATDLAGDPEAGDGTLLGASEGAVGVVTAEGGDGRDALVGASLDAAYAEGGDPLGSYARGLTRGGDALNERRGRGWVARQWCR